MPMQILGGSVVNGAHPLAVAVIQTAPGKHIIGGSTIDAEHPLAVTLLTDGTGINSVPPPGAFRVTNLYAVLVDGQIKLQVEYDDGE